MHRRNFFAIAAAALVSSCVPELAPAESVKLPGWFGENYTDYIARKTGWAEGYDRVARAVVLEPGRESSTRFRHFRDTWKTPRGDVIVACGVDMSYADELKVVKWSGEIIHGRV